MKAHSLLRHAGAGLLSSFLSRNNDVAGYWALGLLYAEARPPGFTVELDLLRGTASPALPCATAVTLRYQHFLQAALARHGVDWGNVDLAQAVIQFNLPARPDANAACQGDPFDMTFTLAANHAAAISMRATGRCYPWRAGKYARSARAS